MWLFGGETLNATEDAEPMGSVPGMLIGTEGADAFCEARGAAATWGAGARGRGGGGGALADAAFIP